MKKVIAILAIMVVLVGVAFAAANETHTIQLKTAVVGTDPIFQFALTSGKLNENDSATTNLGHVAYDEKNDKSYNLDNGIEVADISKTDIDVTFTASLYNQAKSTKVFTLTFSAAPFVIDVLENGVKTEDVPVNPTTQAVALAADLASNTGITAADSSANGLVATIKFNGAECTTGALATYNVVYPKQVNAISTGEDFYTADVKLVVAAN